MWYATKSSCLGLGGESKGHFKTKNQIFGKYLKNPSLDFFDCVYKVRP